MATTSTITVTPSAYLEDSWKGSGIQYPDRGCTSSTSSTYATLSFSKVANDDNYIYYIFDLSDIPSNAVIENITCTYKANISPSSYSQYTTSRYVVLCNGDEEISISKANLTSTASISTITTGALAESDFDRSDFRIKLYGRRGSSSTKPDISINFYGADLEVTYIVPGTSPMNGKVTIAGAKKSIVTPYVTIGGASKPVQSSYARKGGSWVSTGLDETLTLHTWKSIPQ